MAETDYARNLANEARYTAREFENPRFAEVVALLADSIEALAGILEEHDRALRAAFDRIGA